MKTIIVIPTYNEAQNITRLLDEIFRLQIPNLEVIVVDDNSPDGTGDVVANLSQKYKIHLIRRVEKLGLGSAYIAGFALALQLGADKIIEMDADLSHDAADLPALISAADNADLVIGSRKITGGKIIGWGFTRKFMSNGAMWFARAILGLNSKDVTSGFRCFRRHTLELIALDKVKSNGYAFQEELLYRTEQLDLKVLEIPVTFVDRQEGKSKLSKKDIIEFFVNMIRLRFKIG